MCIRDRLGIYVFGILIAILDFNNTKDSNYINKYVSYIYVSYTHLAYKIKNLNECGHIFVILYAK